MKVQKGVLRLITQASTAYSESDINSINARFPRFAGNVFQAEADVYSNNARRTIIFFKLLIPVSRRRFFHPPRKKCDKRVNLEQNDSV